MRAELVFDYNQILVMLENQACGQERLIFAEIGKMRSTKSA